MQDEDLGGPAKRNPVIQAVTRISQVNILIIYIFINYYYLFYVNLKNE